MDRPSLIQSIEDTLFNIFSPIEGEWDVHKEEGVESIHSLSVDFYEFNRLRVLPEVEGNEQDAIKKALEKFDKRGAQSIGFFVGPNSKTSGLPDALDNFNFSFHEKAIGMVRDNSPLPGEDTKYEIREMETDFLTNQKAQRMIEKAYGMPEGSGGMMHSLMKAIEKSTKLVQFMAFDGDNPIGFGNILQAPGTNYGLLSGAATLPEYRGNGIYTTLLRKRIETARDLGLTHLIIQGKEETSAPIAEKNGFEKLSEIEIYVRNTD